MIKPKTAVYIGRFSPFHNGHYETLKYAHQNYDQVIVLIGSGNKRRSPKNPFDTDVICKWIFDSFPKTVIKEIKDYGYDETKWISQVETVVSEVAKYPITIVGHSRDDSSYYLKEFPNWSFEEVGVFADDINGTGIRSRYFNPNSSMTEIFQLESLVPYQVYYYLKENLNTDWYKKIQEEIEFFKNEKEMFSTYPFPETLKFSCSDMIVNCNANILLIKRKFAPGKDTWALPGGYTNQNERFLDGAVRELFEETGIKVSERVIRNCIIDSHVFDNPNRNEGIPRVSNAFYAEIEPDFVGNNYPKLPKVSASDDAAEARWFSLSEIKNMKLFDDHAEVIDYFTKSL